MPITPGTLPNAMEGPSGQLNSLKKSEETDKEGYTQVEDREGLAFILKLARESSKQLGRYQLAPGLDLSNISFEGVSLYNVDFGWADLRSADLRGARITDSDFTGCDLRGVRTDESTDFDHSTFDRVNLSNTAIAFPLSSQSFMYANLEGVTWTPEVWDRADTIDFTEARLRGTDFTMLGRLRLSVVVQLRGAGLIDAKLAGVDLHFMDLRGASLEGADLRGANLDRTNLLETNMAGADLSGASLQYANMTGTNLSGANIEKANLRGSTFGAYVSPTTRARWADIAGAKFEPYLSGEIPGLKQGDYAAIERHFGFTRRQDDGK